MGEIKTVLSMAVHIFIALLLHLKTQQEFLTAQATLKRNEFVCKAKRKRNAVKKARALLSRPGWASQTTLSRLPGLPYLLRRDNSPPRVVSPSRVVSPTSCKRLDKNEWKNISPKVTRGKGFLGYPRPYKQALKLD